MALFQSRHHRANQLIGHYKLDFPFVDLFDLPCLANERLTAVQWAKLAEAQHLPCTVVVSADPSTTGGEYGTFDLFHMTGRNKEAELVHRYQLTHTRALRNMRINGASSFQSSERHEFCTARNTRSGCGIMMVTRPSRLVKPVIPRGEPFGLAG